MADQNHDQKNHDQKNQSQKPDAAKNAGTTDVKPAVRAPGETDAAKVAPGAQPQKAPAPVPAGPNKQ